MTLINQPNLMTPMRPIALMIKRFSHIYSSGNKLRRNITIRKAIKLSFVLLSLLLLTDHARSDDLTKITIRMEMPAKSIARLRYSNDLSELLMLNFRNPSGSRQLISQSVNVTKPTVFRYSIISPKNSFRHHFIAVPGDTVKLILKENYDIALLNTEKARFIEEDVDLFQTVLNHTTDLKRNLSQIYTALDSTLAIYHNTINSLTISGGRKDLLKIIADVYISHLKLNAANWKNVAHNTFTDSVAGNIYNSLSRLTTINSWDLKNLLEAFITYKAGGANPSLMNYIRAARYAGSGIPEKTFILEKLAAFPEKNSPEYKNAISYLKGYLDVPGNAFLEKTVLNPELILTNGKTYTLQKELNDLPSDGLIVLDFWATWCKPCLYEFPFLQQHIKNLRTKKIVFIGISIDKDTDNSQWKTAALTNFGGLENYHNYRVGDLHRKSLLAALKITSIPRYFIINKKGEILNDDFNNPSSKDFIKDLEQYL